MVGCIYGCNLLNDSCRLAAWFLGWTSFLLTCMGWCMISSSLQLCLAAWLAASILLYIWLHPYIPALSWFLWWKAASLLLTSDWLNLLSLCIGFGFFLLAWKRGLYLSIIVFSFSFFLVLGWEPDNFLVPFVTIVAFQLLAGSAFKGRVFPSFFFDCVYACWVPTM